jgi:hypothetical protein
MNSNEMFAEIRRLLNVLEGSASPSAKAPVKSPAASPSAVDAAWVTCTVTYWKVGATKSTGREMGRLGFKVKPDDETQYVTCFDSELMAKFDPLRAGDVVRIITVPWKDSALIKHLEVMSRAAPVLADDDDDSIPF